MDLDGKDGAAARLGIGNGFGSGTQESPDFVETGVVILGEVEDFEGGVVGGAGRETAGGVQGV